MRQEGTQISTHEHRFDAFLFQSVDGRMVVQGMPRGSQFVLSSMGGYAAHPIRGLRRINLNCARGAYENRRGRIRSRDNFVGERMPELQVGDRVPSKQIGRDGSPQISSKVTGTKTRLRFAKHFAELRQGSEMYPRTDAGPLSPFCVTRPHPRQPKTPTSFHPLSVYRSMRGPAHSRSV